MKGFGAVNEWVSTVTGGVPVYAVMSGVDLERALQYGDNHSVSEHLPAIWKKIREDVRREKCFRILTAHEIPNLRVSPFATVVTHKVRIINDWSFDAQSREQKGGLNKYADPDTVPQCLCALALPKLLNELVSRRKKFPEKRILMSKADVSDAFRNVRVDPGKTHNFCYTVGELVVIDFRLTSGWSGSPGFWGVMSAAAEHAHCNPTINSIQLLDERKEMMAHVKVVDHWEGRKPTPIQKDAKIRVHTVGEMVDPFFTTVYVDDYH